MSSDDSASRTLQSFTLGQTKLELSTSLFGANLSSMLLGFIFAQTYMYHRHPRSTSDPRYLQIIVHGLVLLQTSQTALDSAVVYRQLVNGWGSPSILKTDAVISVAGNILPVIAAFTGGIVQYYYIARIQVLAPAVFGPRFKTLFSCISIVMGTLPLLSCSSALSLAIIVAPAPFGDDYITYVISVTLATWAISSAVVDAAITICMIAFLYYAKSATHLEETRGRYSRTLHATLQTGFITAALAILEVILLLGVPVQDRYFYTFPWYIIGKSYVISLLSILNARVPAGFTIHGSDNRTPCAAGLSTLEFIPGSVLASERITENNGGLIFFLRSFRTRFAGKPEVSLTHVESNFRSVGTDEGISTLDNCSQATWVQTGKPMPYVGMGGKPELHK